MIRSMTGFGRADFEVATVPFQVEVRTVNHRNLDLGLRLPRLLSGREATFRAQVSGVFGRGKVDVSVGSAATERPATELVVDERAAEIYVEAGRVLSERHGLEADLTLAALLALPGVARFVEAELDAEEVATALGPALDQAVAQALEMREREGQALAADLGSRLGTLDALVAEIESRAAEVQEHVRARLRKRAEQLARETGVHDEGRLHQEIVIAADRMDVTEEIVRLRSHFEQFRAILTDEARAEPVGRRLDFLVQELLREVNTIGSKGGDSSIAHRVVDLKSEIERIREQTQNVE